jgi:hypothetical protein
MRIQIRFLIRIPNTVQYVDCYEDLHEEDCVSPLWADMLAVSEKERASGKGKDVC